MRWLFPLLASVALAVASAAPGDNRVTYLDTDGPYHPKLGDARLTTPQWIGEPGVEAAVIIGIDDLRGDTKPYEDYLRPILERLKQIDGRAPASIFCNNVRPDDPQLQTWLTEGVSVDVHTLTHPCPLLGKDGSFTAAEDTYFGGIDLLAAIPGNKPTAFRMPCCDSMNSVSPRFFAEIFPRLSKERRSLAIDSSVMCLLTPADPALPREIVTEEGGGERFRKYFPMEMVPPRKRTFERFAGYIENYPYPYVIGSVCWEFPNIVPSDWEVFNLHGARQARTTEDWKAALDAVVIKQGVMTMVVHPHGWSDPTQVVELINYAVAKYGPKVKFLNFREALERLEKNLLNGQSLRASDGSDNGVRLRDLNRDGWMDVIIGNEQTKLTRLWDPAAQKWHEAETPLIVKSGTGSRVHFGITRKDGALTMLSERGAWIFEGNRWKETPELMQGLDELPVGSPGIHLRDLDRDRICELVALTPAKSTILRWVDGEQRWRDSEFQLPEDVLLANPSGGDDGLRFVDLNGDGFEDILLSNEQRFSIHLWTKEAKPHLGWKPGWSQMVRQGERKGVPNEPPMIARGGPHRNNGVWFRDGHMVVQNEDTAKLEGVVDRRSFQELIAFDVPPPLAPEESLKAMEVGPGFTVELVAAEPLVVDPIAFEWDAKGRLWVVEMRDYPLGLDGKGKPGGVIKVLEDADRDGRYEKATAFLEDLPFPTGVMPWRKGVLICAAPDIFYAEDTDGDGRADLRRVLFTGFKPGNQQHRANGFEWGLDGWIYGANGDSGGTVKSLLAGAEISISGRDFRFRPDTGEIEAESGATQYGRRRDDWGNWFGNNNPTWLWHYTLPERYLRRNSGLAVKSTRKVLANYDSPTRVFPISKQPERFNQPQSLGHVTSACSPAPYRDDLFGPGFENSVFISEPVHNAVHREVLSRVGGTFTSQRADEERAREFLASRDVWFRPTMVKTGPDGALYVADMYRFVLEHPEWIAPETLARLDVRAGEDRGRIYRVRPSARATRPIPNLASLNPAALLDAMESPSGWQRDTAQRLLYERGDHSVAPLLSRLAAEARDPKVRVQALASLDTLGVADDEAVRVALSDPEPAVRVNALKVSERVAEKFPGLLKSVLVLLDDSDKAVRQQLAFTLGGWKSPASEAALARLAQQEGDDEEMRIAILSAVSSDHPLMKLAAGDREPARKASPPAATLAPRRDRKNIIASYAPALRLRGKPERGRTVFLRACATCHRARSEGRELGPDLAMVAGKPDDWLLTAIFDPNQALEARYRAQHVATKAGEEMLGLIVSETANNITLRLADGSERPILRADIARNSPLEQSLMPEGLESVLSHEDVADLISFLRQ